MQEIAEETLVSTNPIDDNDFKIVAGCRPVASLGEALSKKLQFYYYQGIDPNKIKDDEYAHIESNTYIFSYKEYEDLRKTIKQKGLKSLELQSGEIVIVYCDAVQKSNPKKKTLVYDSRTNMHYLS